MKFILVSQRLINYKSDLYYSLSGEWSNFFNKFEDIMIIPIFNKETINLYMDNLEISGIIITGGNDIYNKNESYDVLTTISSQLRDELELHLIDRAIQKNIPVLAICRGCQLLAYHDNFKLEKQDNHVRTKHNLISVNKSRYVSIDSVVNSYHDYVIIPNESDNYNIIALSHDGYVEAIEHKEHKILGIMWHPERENYTNNQNCIVSDFFNVKLRETQCNPDGIAVILLCAGMGTRLRPLTNDIPKCLVKYKNKSIIDYIQEALEKTNLDNDIIFITGYKYEKIVEHFNLTDNYIINKNYNTTNMLYSLFFDENIFNHNKDIIISYTDIIYKPSIIEKLKNSNHPISIITDNDWKKLWETRMDDPLSDAETLKVDENNYILEIGNKPTSYDEINGQYIGLIKISSDYVKIVRDYYINVISKLDNYKQMAMTQFLNIITKELCPIKVIPINGGWCEFDTCDDLKVDIEFTNNTKKLKFQTKAENLYNLKDIITTANISEMLYFTYYEWINSRTDIINRINDKFKNEHIMIRSSCSLEDTNECSNAGAFLSIDINNYNDDILVDKINKVFLSYCNPDCNPDFYNDQVLIQLYISDINYCGVIFTKDMSSNFPYYIITYDSTNSNNSVTSGKSNDNQINIIKYSSSDSNCIQSKNMIFNKVIKLTDELTTIYDTHNLDIEFAFNMQSGLQSGLHLLQVRQLVTSNMIHKIDKNKLDKYYKICYNRLAQIINQTSYDLNDGKNIYSIMTDWNPAEIIGVKPNKLALSLYTELITDKIALKSRDECGYENIEYYPIMISIFDRPYIDLKVSFNSFIPKDIPEKIRCKLTNYYLDIIRNDTKLYDKVEFDLLFTCNTLNIDDKLKILLNNDFTQNEIDIIKKQLIILTNNIIDNAIKINMDNISKLETRLNSIIKDNNCILGKIFMITRDIKIYGTLAFANLARFAFIAKQILDSLKTSKLISNDDFTNFMLSMNTISKELSNDLNNFINKESESHISKDEFLAKYGHLRPGTYDICSESYLDNFNKYFPEIDSNNTKINKQTFFSLTNEQIGRINQKLKTANFNCSAENLFIFIKESTELREYSKYIFTKSVSILLDLITKFGREYNISKNELKHLDFQILLDLHKNIPFENIYDIITDNIKLNKQRYNITSNLLLPQIITHEDDIYEFTNIKTKPLFISNKIIKGRIIYLNNMCDNLDKLDNMIICIENADPGWDWLFSRNIMGLITCYGGSNSHMAIRCQELNLTAVIGSGIVKFESIIKSKVIEINPLSELVNIIY